MTFQTSRLRFLALCGFSLLAGNGTLAYAKTQALPPCGFDVALGLMTQSGEANVDITITNRLRTPMQIATSLLPEGNKVSEDVMVIVPVRSPQVTFKGTAKKKNTKETFVTLKQGDQRTFKLALQDLYEFPLGTHEYYVRYYAVNPIPGGSCEVESNWAQLIFFRSK